MKPLVFKVKNTISLRRITTYHNDVEFDLDEESEGTRKIFSLIGPWIDALLNGRTLVVDELDVKLHHDLNLFLINLFHDPVQNKKNAQLIFTTHDVNLLDLDVFRRDQIWFTEKDKGAGTQLYSMSDYKERKPRKGEAMQRGYLAGRYGAIPILQAFNIPNG